MKHRGLACCAAIGAIFAVAPEAAFALPTCAELATNSAYGLAGNPQVSGATAALQPASGPTTAYCRVDFVFSGESGPSAGYLPGQSQRLVIRVGLPPNSVDLTPGAVPWNGKNRDIGRGGFARAGGGGTSPSKFCHFRHSTRNRHPGAPGGKFP